MPENISATILVVDDEQIILDIVKEHISINGFRAIVALSAGEAFRIAEKQGKIDLLLMDIMIPGKNGFDLAREIVSLHPDIRILFMSGVVDPSRVQEQFLDTDCDFIAKPFDLDMLINKIRSALPGSPVSS